MWLKSFVVASLLQVSVAGISHAKGPFGSVNVGNWIGGAFSNDETGAFSHCAATTPYANGVILVVSQNAAGTWSLAFASPSYRFNKGENAAIDVTFDGQEQARLFATAYQPNMLTAIMPVNVVWSELGGLNRANLRREAANEVRRARATYLEYPTTA